MAKKILLGLVAFVVVLLGVIAMQPSEYRVERSITIDAPAAEVFPWVADLRKFSQWSPWEKLDPDIEKTFEGPATGVGSVYKWSGNADVGKGSMTVTEFVADEKVTMSLEFVEPWQSKATTGLSLAPAGDTTEVTWSMSGENDFMSKAVGLFMDMEEMIGKDYEEGLANLEKVVEAVHDSRSPDAT